VAQWNNLAGNAAEGANLAQGSVLHPVGGSGPQAGAGSSGLIEDEMMEAFRKIHGFLQSLKGQNGTKEDLNLQELLNEYNPDSFADFIKHVQSSIEQANHLKSRSYAKPELNPEPQQEETSSLNKEENQFTLKESLKIT